MDLASTFADVLRIAQTATDPVAGWDSLWRYLERGLGNPLPPTTVAFDEDIRAVQAQLEALVKAEPPPLNLNAVYFGLFDAVDDRGVEQIG